MHVARNIIIFSILAIAVIIALLMWNPDAWKTDGEGGRLLLYCAAGMKPPVERIAKQYEEEYGVRIQIQYGGSGTLLSNLSVADTGDLYLAADDSYLETARRKNLVRETIPLARLKPVIVVREGNPKKIQSLNDLLRDDVRLALANPEAAAVGRITKQLLQTAEIWSQVEPRVAVFKPTVFDIPTDIKIGAVDAGIVWDSVAAQFSDLEIVPIPELDKGIQNVTIGVLGSAKNPTAALRFARYLGARDRGLLEFKQRGYQTIRGDIWAITPDVVLFSGGVNRVAIEETLKQFQEREGVSFKTVYNGCGILVGMMKAGQRPDAYFACDVSFMDDVTDLFLDSVDVAETSMVIVVPKGNPKSIQTMDDLTKPGLRIGVANPEQSALGALTRNLLEDAGLYEAVSKNVKSRTPTADMLVNQIRTGSLDAVVVYEANTSKVRDHLDVVTIDHPKALAIQPYATGRNSDNQHLMNRLLETILSAESQSSFESTGFRWRAGQKNQ